MADNKITTGVEFKADASSVTKESAKAAAAVTSLRLKAEKEAKKMQAATKETASGIGDIGSAIGGAVGDITSLGTAIVTATGPLAALALVVGGIAQAWKQSKEQVELYLKTADKVKFGSAGFRIDAKESMAQTKQRAKGGIAAGGSAVFEAQKILNERTNLTKEQRAYYELQIKSGQAMVKENLLLLDSVDGFKDKASYQQKMTKLQEQSEVIQDNIEDSYIRVSELNTTIAEQKAIVTDKDATSAEIEAASVKVKEAALDKMKLQQSVLQAQLDNLTAISTLEGTLEGTERQRKKLQEEINNAAVEYNSTIAKGNKYETKALKLSKERTAEIKAQTAMVSSKAQGAPTKANTSGLILPKFGSMPTLEGIRSSDPDIKGQLDALDAMHSAGLVAEADFLKQKRDLDLASVKAGSAEAFIVQAGYENSLLELKKQKIAEYGSVVSDTLGSIGQIIENQKQKELSAAGDNATKRAEIEKKYAKKQKAIAITQAIIATALGVVKAIPNIPLMAFAAAAGAANIGVIASQKFAAGGIVSGETLATVGEYAGAKNNPEVIAPLDKLRTILGDTGGGEVSFRIEGDALVGVLNKQNRKSNSYR